MAATYAKSREKILNCYSTSLATFYAFADSYKVLEGIF